MRVDELPMKFLHKIFIERGKRKLLTALQAKNDYVLFIPYLLVHFKALRIPFVTNYIRIPKRSV